MIIQPNDYMSKTFNFVHLNPLHPMLSQLGVKRVSSIVLHESDDFELGLTEADLSDLDDIEYYRFSELQITSV